MPSADGGIAKDHDRYWRARAIGKCVQHGCPSNAEDGVYCKPCAKKRYERRYDKPGHISNSTKEHERIIEKRREKTVFEVRCVLQGLTMDVIEGLKTGGDVVAAIKRHSTDNEIVVTPKNAHKIYEVRRNKNIVKPEMWVAGVFK